MKTKYILLVVFIIAAILVLIAWKEGYIENYSYSYDEVWHDENPGNWTSEKEDGITLCVFFRCASVYKSVRNFVNWTISFGRVKTTTYAIEAGSHFFRYGWVETFLPQRNSRSVGER